VKFADAALPSAHLPNPIARDEDPYVPVNSPAIGDLFDLFDFGHHDR